MSSSTIRLGVAVVLALVYAGPLFFPPATPGLGVPTAADAWLLARIFPGVSAPWVGLRLVALAGAAFLLASAAWPVAARAAEPGHGVDRSRQRRGRFLALALAAVPLMVAPWAGRLGPAGQVAYLAMLFVPAVVLAWSEGLALPRAAGGWRASAPAAVVILVWIVSRLVTDLGSPRVADVIDGWRGFLDTARFVAEKQNLLTDLFDPKLPGLGGVLLLFHGVPFFQADLVPFSFRAVQSFQILWVAMTAAGVGLLARMLLGPGVAVIAVTVFLFAPYTRFVTIFPGPFLAGPLYATAVALSAVAVWRWRSEAALAALGASCGIALTFPSVVPAVMCVLAWTAWHLRDFWRERWVGVVVGLAAFVAVLVPAVANVLRPGDLGGHFRWDGLLAIIDAGLLGQLPLATTPPAFKGVSPRPFDIVVAAVLAPFAHPRMHIRLWGDALFDPVGTVLIAVGLAASVRAALCSSVSRVVLLFAAAVLCPAFVSPVDVVDIVHAVALPVPAALLAAAGFIVLRQHVRALADDARATPPPRRRLLTGSVTVALVAVSIALGGTVLFDVVNPRILSASSFGIMFQVLRPDATDRVVVLSYGPGFVRPTKTLYTGPITAFAGPRPVGYLEWDGGELPAAELAAERKDLLFWSHGFDQDLGVTAVICRQWPGAVVYEVWDAARLGRVHAARVGGSAWEPEDAEGRWSSRECASAPASRPAPPA